MMYTAVLGIFSSEELRIASSVLSEQSTNNMMKNSSVSSAGTGPAKVSCGWVMTVPQEGPFSTKHHKLRVQVNEVQITALL